MSTKTDEVVCLKLANERLAKLSKLIWETRWVSDEQDYIDMVGIAAAINSGNYKPIDNLKMPQ